jgi:hypothetical protein
MRGILGLIGLLVALAVSGVLVRQQMKAVKSPVPALQLPAVAGDDAKNVVPTVTMPASGTPAQQSQQIQQQFKQALDNAMQTRPMPEDKP